MPNAKILSEKQAIVASLTEKFQNAAAGVIVDYRGITVAEDTELRAKMRENGVEYFVVKNTLARFAAKNAGLDELCDVLDELGGQRAGAGEIQRFVLIKGRNHRGNDAPNVFHGKVAHKPVSLCVVVYTVRLICGKVNP